MRIMSGVVLGALLCTPAPLNASNATSFDKARVAYGNLELPLYAVWAVVRSAHYGFAPAELTNSLDFLDNSGHVRALLLAGSLYEQAGNLGASFNNTSTPNLDAALYVDKSYRDDIYGVGISALRLCVLTGYCPKDSILSGMLDQYFATLHVVAPVAERLRNRLNNGSNFALAGKYDLPTVEASDLTARVSGWLSAGVIPLLGFAQTTTWLSATLTAVLSQHGLVSAEVVANRHSIYKKVQTIRSFFFVAYMTLLGGEMAVNAFVDYAIYYLAGSEKSSITGRDEL